MCTPGTLARTLIPIALGASLYGPNLKDFKATSFQDASHQIFNQKKAIGHAALDRQYLEYAHAISRAKIVLVSGSVNNYALRKYTEAAMAGALLIGDIPCERAEEFREYVVEISRSDTDQKIAAVVEWWRTHDAERVARAEHGRRIALAYATKRALGALLNKSEAFMLGKRGIYYEHPVECEIGSSAVRAAHPEESRTSVIQQLLAAVHNDAPFVANNFA